jgi:hypothetical protein
VTREHVDLSHDTEEEEYINLSKVNSTGLLFAIHYTNVTEP